MKNFDKYIKEQLAAENSVPESVHERIESTLASLPQINGASVKHTVPIPKNPMRFCRVSSACAACFFFVFLFILPNVSIVYAENVKNIPVIGSLVEIFTIRNYLSSDENHEINMQTPSVTDTANSKAAEDISTDIDTLTETVLEKFYEEYGGDTASLHIDYETVTNTDAWFTLKLSVSETSAGGYNYSKFYHIDRSDGSTVTFGDLFDAEGMSGIAKIIVGKMEEEMAADSEMIYWVDDITVDAEMIMWSDSSVDSRILIGIPEAVGNRSSGAETAVVISAGKIPCVSSDQNFYFTDDGGMVVVYDEYTVAPGSMGCPEILLTEEEYTPYLRDGK